MDNQVPVDRPVFDPQINFTIPDQFQSTRERIMADPALRLSFHIENQKAQEQAQQVDVKRHTDSAVLPLILQDMEKNQAHMDDLNQRIEQFTNNLATPYPLRRVAELGWGDVLGGGLVALSGGKVGDALGAAQNNANQREDIRYGNEVNQFNQTQATTARGLSGLQHDYDQLAAEQRGLRGEQLSQASHEADVAAAATQHATDVTHNDLEKARDRFQHADNEGEVIQAAADLAAAGHPVAPDALEAAKKSAGLKMRKQDTSEAAQQYAAIARQIDMYGGVAGSQADALDTLVSGINARYGTAYPPVVGGPTWKAKNAEDQAKYRDQVRQDKAKQFQQMFDLKDKEVTAHIADWASDRAFQRERLGIERTRANADLLRATNSGGIQTAQKRIVDIQAQLDSVGQDKREIANDVTLTPSQKKAKSSPLYGKEASLKAKLRGYQAVLDFIVKQSEKDDEELGSGGGTPVASGGDVVYNNGGVTITKH